MLNGDSLCHGLLSGGRYKWYQVGNVQREKAKTTRIEKFKDRHLIAPAKVRHAREASGAARTLSATVQRA